MPEIDTTNDSNHVADVIEIKHFLKGHDFTALEVFSARDGPSSITIHLEPLTGVSIPWLSDVLNDRGWHIQKVENSGETMITLKEGTDPYVPE